MSDKLLTPRLSFADIADRVYFAWQLTTKPLPADPDRVIRLNQMWAEALKTWAVMA